jgi:hypothetical protein
MVANRCLSPYSKLYCWEQWIGQEVYLPSARPLQLHHLYLAMDFLEQHKPEVEKSIYFAMADLMNADVDVIFYDTTSLHFEVDEEDEAESCKFERVYEPLRKRGHSKNGRDDAPQIVVGLAVTRDGLPVRSWVFSGQTADVTTVEQIKNDLRGWRLGRCIFVGDAGMNSVDNRRTLALGNGKYILGSRMRAGDEVTQEVMTRQGRYHEVRDGLRVKEVFVGCRRRRRRVPLSAGSPVPRDPPGDAEAVLRPGQPRSRACVVDALGRYGAPGVRSPLRRGRRVGQGRAMRKPFSRTKRSERSVSLSAMTCALSASGKTLVQSLKGRLVVMQVERR